MGNMRPRVPRHPPAAPVPEPFAPRRGPGPSPAVPYAPRGSFRSISRANSAEPNGIASSLKS